MSQLKRYKVIGRFKGKRIEEIITAYSKKQAKLQAGFNNGFYGSELSGFMRSKNVRVIEKR